MLILEPHNGELLSIKIWLVFEAYWTQIRISLEEALNIISIVGYTDKPSLFDRNIIPVSFVYD